MRPNRSDVSFDGAAGAHHFIQDRDKHWEGSADAVGVRPRPLSPQIDQALTRQPRRRRTESGGVPRRGDASPSNARMRMSAIGWPVAAILPLDNIGAM